MSLPLNPVTQKDVPDSLKESTASSADQETTTTSSKITQFASQALSATANSIPQGLVYVDHVFDLIPFVGTASNAIDLGLKTLVKDVDPSSSYFKTYIEHVQRKETKKCLAFGVPFVGTVAKLGTIAYNLYAPSSNDETYTIVDKNDVMLEDFEGISTIGLRLKREEEAIANATVFEIERSKKK